MDQSKPLEPEPMRRVAPNQTVQREIWARAAGRCTLCATYLLKASYEYKSVAVGQIAHEVGATDALGSPRGESALTAAERAGASNLMLLCQPCHNMVDDDPERYSVEWLARQKDSFENRVREVTNFPTLAPTAVIVFTSPIRGNAVRISGVEVSEALQFSNLQFAGDDVRDAKTTIALSLPETADGAWSAGAARIKHDVEKLHLNVGHTGAESLSVFGLGPIPFLVLLGAEIGTKLPVHVFDSHRQDDRTQWRWPVITGEPAEFEYSVSGEDANADEIAVCVSVTAHVQHDRLPEPVTHLPRLDVSIQSEPVAGAISSPEALRNFSRVWRDALQSLELHFPAANKLHVFCATPASVSIEVGRQRMRDAHPSMLIYQLTSLQVYVPTLLVE